MTVITGKWFSVDDHDMTTENGTITVQSVDRHTGRSNRRGAVMVTTAHGSKAHTTVTQGAAGVTLSIMGVIDSDGEDVKRLGSGVATYYIVGYSNCPLLTTNESSTEIRTSMNSRAGKPTVGGFSIKDGNKVIHSGIAINQTIQPDYGAEAQYEFRIPFDTLENTTYSDKIVVLNVFNTSLGVSDSVTVTQNAKSGQPD